MQPHFVGFADVGECGDGVVGAEDGGAGRGVEVEGRLAGFFGFFYEGDEGVGVHAAGFGGNGDGDDGGGAEAELLRGLGDAVVAVGGGEEDEFEVVGCVAVGFGHGVEGVAGDYYGCCVGAGASLYGNSACMGSVEAELFSEGSGRVLFDYGQCGGYFVRVDVGVEGSEDQFGRDAGSVG